MAQKEPPPNPGMLPSNSTFVAYYASCPVACVSVYFTNTKEIAWIENFVGNPEFKGALRKQVTEALITHCEQFAKHFGFKRLVCLTNKQKIKARYQELGFKPTLEIVTTLVKEI